MDHLYMYRTNYYYTYNKIQHNVYVYMYAINEGQNSDLKLCKCISFVSSSNLRAEILTIEAWQVSSYYFSKLWYQLVDSPVTIYSRYQAAHHQRISCYTYPIVAPSVQIINKSLNKL